MNILGIDPGKSGAVVLLNERYIVDWWCAPIIGKEYNGFEMQRISVKVLGYCGPLKTTAFIEFQNAGAYNKLKIGATSIFQMGLGYGRWLQALEGNGIPYRTVTPAMWMKKFASKAKISGKERKAYHVLLARRMWPTSVPWDKLPKDAREGIAEAALIAEYGRTN